MKVNKTTFTQGIQAIVKLAKKTYSLRRATRFHPSYASVKWLPASPRPLPLVKPSLVPNGSKPVAQVLLHFFFV